MHKRMIIAAAVFAILALTGFIVALIPGTAHATASHHGHIRPAGCVTYDIWGQPANSMPYDEPMTFCAPGIKTATFTCPQGTGVAPAPGSRIYCTKD